MGAEVIRIDRKAPPVAPNPFPMLGTKYDVMARGRRSLALDLKLPAARDVVLRLAEQADIVLEGFRPGVMARLGLGPDAALTGMLHAMGRADTPPFVDVDGVTQPAPAPRCSRTGPELGIAPARPGSIAQRCWQTGAGRKPRSRRWRGGARSSQVRPRRME